MTYRLGLSVLVAAGVCVEPILYDIVTGGETARVSLILTVNEVGVVTIVLCSPASTPTPAMFIISPVL